MPSSILRENELLDQEQVVTWLKAEGIIRDPIPEEYHLAAEWDGLKEEEKQAIQWELDHVPSGPMVSDLIAENRR